MLCAFTTRQEAKSSYPAPRNIGSRIFGRTSRHRTQQRLRAGYHHRNLGKIRGPVQHIRPTEFHCARRGMWLSTSLQAAQSPAARDGHGLHAASTGQDHSADNAKAHERSSGTGDYCLLLWNAEFSASTMPGRYMWPPAIRSVMPDSTTARAAGRATFLYVPSGSREVKLRVSVCSPNRPR